jgi:hypothetical protein
MPANAQMPAGAQTLNSAQMPNSAQMSTPGLDFAELTSRINNEGDFRQAFGFIERDEHKTRNFESMQIAIQRMTILGQLRDFDLYTCAMSAIANKNLAFQYALPADELMACRSYIAAMAGLGLAWLDRTGKDEIVFPKSLDMGGRASMALAYSKAMIEDAISITTRLEGSSVNGRKVGWNEIDDLRRISDFIDQKLAQVDGPHDLERAKKSLMDFLMPAAIESQFGQYLSAEREQKYGRDFYIDTGHKIVSFINEASSKGISIMADPLMSRMVAKLLRDQALAMVAHAEVKLKQGDFAAASNLVFGTPEGRLRFVSGTNTSRGYDGAIEALKLSESLVPNNPDLLVLQEMLLKVWEGVPLKVA